MSDQTLQGAIVLILNSHDEVLLLLRPPHALWSPNLWAFPGGKIEEDETPYRAAIRETLEETQLAVKNLKLVKLDVDIEVKVYYTRDYNGEVQIDEEHVDWQWAPLQSLTAPDYFHGMLAAPGVIELFEWVLENE
jgi:8-oxo-dGTP pyrophosphatase MutT (NUDIX family)